MSDAPLSDLVLRVQPHVTALGVHMVIALRRILGVEEGESLTSWPPNKRLFFFAFGGLWCLHNMRTSITKRRKDVELAKKMAEDTPHFKLIRSVGEECQTDQELRGLLKMKKNRFRLYDGFEPSGRMHIAQGIFKAMNVNKCTEAGGTFIFWVADWFALMNDKMGGDLEKIKTVGLYLIEVWKATGMDMSRVRFLWSSDEIANRSKEYWGYAMDVARKSTLARVKKCCQIMGRTEDVLTAAQIMYPIMQAADIFFLDADVCQLGVDQRKVNMLARDYCDIAGRRKPVILSHHMLYGLKAGQAKMSKSDPDSAIFMEDTPEDVERKIRNAYCPLKPDDTVVGKVAAEDMQLVQDDLMNPCLDYLKYVLFCKPGYVFTAGGHLYSDFEAAKKAFLEGVISENLLKDRLVEEINKLLDPVRRHFQNDTAARELLAKVRQWKKENMVPPTAITMLKALGSESADVFAVFALPPSGSVKIASALQMLGQLALAPADSRAVLWLADWTAVADGCLGGSEKRIHGYYELLLFCMRKLAPERMASVRVIWQSLAVLEDPSSYWISVINVGRKSSIENVRAALKSGQKLEYASQVLSTLMHIGDVLAMSGPGCLTLCCNQQERSLQELAMEKCKASGADVPKLHCVNLDNLALQLEIGSKVTEAQANIMLGDDEATVRKKVKKAFCDPSNLAFCPPLSWVSALWMVESTFDVNRDISNGGDVSYKEYEAVKVDFQSGKLHPGDLKAALGTNLVKITKDITQAVLASETLKKALHGLDSFQSENRDPR